MEQLRPATTGNVNHRARSLSSSADYKANEGKTKVSTVWPCPLRRSRLWQLLLVRWCVLTATRPFTKTLSARCASAAYCVPCRPARTLLSMCARTYFTNNAGPQQNNTPNANIGGGELQAKPESNITWSLQTVTVKTFAHWIRPAVKCCQDAPMLQGLIDTELSYGLNLESDDQLLLGDGTNQNVTGLLVDADVSDVAPDAATVAAADLGAAYIAHIRKAVTTLQTFEYYNINGITLNPVDWETIETAKATDGHFLLVPFAATNAEAVAVSGVCL